MRAPSGAISFSCANWTGALQTAGFFLLLLGIWQGGRTVLAALVLMFAPAIGSLLQLALSRAREYDADLEAAQITGDPEGLASALAALERRQGALWESFVLPGARIPAGSTSFPLSGTPRRACGTCPAVFDILIMF